MKRTFNVLLFTLLFAGAAFAQSTTATIRGRVHDEAGAALAGAEVSAVSTSSGFVRSVTAGPDGSFTLGGLTPGEFKIVIASAGFEPLSQTLRVLVGQNVDVDFVLSKTATLAEEITVVGNQVVETKTPEAATNVTTQQIENLPQSDRNFLNFAALAPGIRLSADPLRKTIASDAQGAEQTNVFIDGVSYKNDILQGGVSGQDASRGNPFPQNAVQEFRVITQGFSAQYEKASSAIITAITKSGGNELNGELFYFYQPREWVEDLPKNFQFQSFVTNADYHRHQPGFSIGGPITKDKLHFFVSYEGDQEHAVNSVAFNNAQLNDLLRDFVGTFPSPFRSTLGFGKVSWQPSSDQLVDFTANYRKEDEIRDFGGAVSYQTATDLHNYVHGATVRHQWTTNSTLNQAALTWQNYGWQTKPVNPDLVGQDFQGVIRIGGNTSTQQFDQRRIELRDDFNFSGPKWHGDHAFQVGGNVDFMRYEVNKSQNANPVFNYTFDPANNRSFAQPFEAIIGFGNPRLNRNNQEIGIYGQDNWTVNDKLAVTLGLRWDYETDMIDSDYVTPAKIVTALTGKIDSDYFSSGDDREPYKKEIQPRVGFTYDLRGDSKSVIFGGAGRYYDRLFLNAGLDERYRLQFPVYRIEFSVDGSPRFGGPTIKWDPKYFSAAGLRDLIASGATNPEIFVLHNKTKPPYSNQFNLGYRQAIGNWLGSVSYNLVRGYHGFTWLSAAPNGLCCAALVPGFGNVIKSDPEGKRTWYNGLFVTLDRPYANRWSAHFAWTHAKAEQNGNDLFSLDYPSAAQYPRHEVEGTERDRIHASGIFGLPWDVRFSTIVSLGTGAATDVLDFSKGFSLENRLETQPFKRSIRPPKEWGFADRSVDFRLEKTFPAFRGTSIGIIAEMFNAFNWPTYGCLADFIPPEGNPNLGTPGCVTNLPRREQLGVRLRF